MGEATVVPVFLTDPVGIDSVVAALGLKLLRVVQHLNIRVRKSTFRPLIAAQQVLAFRRGVVPIASA